MYKFILGILFFFIGHSIFAQNSSDVGIIVGANYYLGDINPSKQLYSSSPTVGFMYRYNMGPRYALRTSLSLGNLKGDDLDFDNKYQQDRNHSFETELVEFSLQMEFNFQPFLLPLSSRAKRFSPYITSGLSYISSSSTTSSIAIPMGVGCKYIIGKRWTAAVEWSFKKTFTDDLDGLSDPNKLNIANKLHNDDWISFLGVTLTLQLFNDLQCHAYDRIVK
ncbi:type IX secretion system protein PorG [Ancylomarina sp. YFZ004]